MESNTFPITEDMLQPILDTLIANLNVFLPILLGIFGLVICIRVVPPLISNLLDLR